MTRLRRVAARAAFGLTALVGVTLCAVASAQEPDPDLIKLGQSVLPDDDNAPARRPVRRPVVKASDAGAAARAPAADAGVVADAGAVALGAPADAGELIADLAAPDAASSVPAALAVAEPTNADADAGAQPAAPASVTPAVTPVPAGAMAPVALGPAARKARIESGQNLALKAAEESPLAKLGVPPAAVPAVATTATVGVMAFWPFLAKTLTGLAKSFFGAFLKTRAKKGKTVDRTQKVIRLAGFSVRPAELGQLLVGALVYGLGVCYAFQGKNLSPSFLVSQEALVIVIYYARSFIRFGYERVFNLPTQFRFWPGGGMLCLASAYLGNTLGTVGYEVEETRSADDANRIAKMKALLVWLSIAMALAFFVANLAAPNKILQSGRVMMSGMALAEILPITPMPGKKIRDWNPSAWWVLVVTVVPSFVLMNFVL